MANENKKNKRIQLSFITPTNFIKSHQGQGDFVLGLSHLMKLDKVTAYEKAILSTKLPIVLDNGLFENHTPEPLDSLILKATKIGATHFFAPDMLYDTKGTQESLNKTITAVRKAKKGLSKESLKNFPKIAAVVQANNAKDYMAQLHEFNQNPNVKLIGASILSVPKCFGGSISESRIKLLKRMRKDAAKGYVWKPMHLLGLGSDLKDVMYAKKHCKWVVSHDSSSAFWNAMQGKKILEDGVIEGGKTGVHVDFSFKEATKKQLELAQNNINRYRELLS